MKFRFIASTACALIVATPIASETLIQSESDILGRLVRVELIYTGNVDSLERATVAVIRNKDDSFLGDVFVSNTQTGDKVAVSRKLLTFVTAWEGAKITMLDKGGFQIETSSLNVSRSYFDQTLTFAYRDGAFILAGITRVDHDRNYAAGFTCDHNLLSGKIEWTASALKADVEINESGKGQTPPLRLLLADLSRDDLPSPCNTQNQAFFERLGP